MVTIIPSIPSEIIPAFSPLAQTLISASLTSSIQGHQLGDDGTCYG